MSYVVLAILLALPPTATAVTYTVGNGGDYATLDALRSFASLQNGDTIVLNGDDNSLCGSFVTSLTLKGSGVISPAAPNVQFFNATYRNITLDSSSVEFRNFSSVNSSGGVIAGDNVTFSGGTYTFTGNSATAAGFAGAVYGLSSVTFSGGTNTFTSNTGYDGGAIWSSTVTLSGGTNTFTDNSAGRYGGAIRGQNVTLSGGTNTFTGNSASGNAGYGGAIFADTATLRATDGDFIFRGNRDRVGMVNEKANAIYLNTSSAGSGINPLTLAAEAGQSIYFYDPVETSNGALHSTININNQATDTGRVVFDGSDYTRVVDRHSAVYGNTTVGYGELVLNGNVVYGGATNSGSFTLNEWATLTTDNTVNRIQAYTITMNGLVDIANGGRLELAANSRVNINGTISLGLGIDSFASLSAIGNLTFGNNATASLYWDDSFDSLYNGWTQDYVMSDLFSATGTMTGFGNLFFDASSFIDRGFDYSWNGNILTLTYNGAEVPEPATLAILGLGLAGLGLARRRK